jgi:hypothetical protein
VDKKTCPIAEGVMESCDWGALKESKLIGINWRPSSSCSSYLTAFIPLRRSHLDLV